MNRVAATRWVFILALSLLCLHSVRAEASAAVEVCNDGDVTVKTAAINTTNPFFAGTTYYVAGWYNIEPGKCTFVSDGGALVNGSYLGFAYEDDDGILRAHIAKPSGQADSVEASSEQFCVALDGRFDYSTRASAGSCQAGYAPLTFSIYMDFSSIYLARVTYTVAPHHREGGEPLGGTAEMAQMLFGEKVRRVGKTWLFATGKPLSDSLVNEHASLPPLVPRVQFSPNKEPVAGYLRQIEQIVGRSTACRANSSQAKANYMQMRIGVSERGVAISAYSQESDAMLLADMDLPNATIKHYEGGGNFAGDCWILEIACKRNLYEYCGEHRYADRDGTRSSAFDIYMNTRDQAVSILDLLKRISPAYPDATPEISKLQ